MKWNGRVYRQLRAPKSASPDNRVHLGPGQRNYIPGWINIDANMFSAKCDVWADLRNPLPLRSNTIAWMYSHHVIEHLPNLGQHFDDVYRCLRPGGVYRFGGPNGDAAMRAYVSGDLDWFSDFPDRRRSIGGRLENFVFCRQEHLTILTESYLREIAEDNGFDVSPPLIAGKETQHPDAFNKCLELEHEPDCKRPHTLMLEARKRN